MIVRFDLQAGDVNLEQTHFKNLKSQKVLDRFFSTESRKQALQDKEEMLRDANRNPIQNTINTMGTTSTTNTDKNEWEYLNYFQALIFDVFDDILLGFTKK